MPELPEVETVKRQLGEVLPGMVVDEVEVLNEKSFVGEFGLRKKDLLGSVVVGTRRFGKVLVVNLEKLIANSEKVKTKVKKLKVVSQMSDVRCQLSLVVHLKMTGQLIYEPHGVGNVDHRKHRLVGGHLLRQGSGQATHRERIVGGHPTRDWLSELPSRHTRVVFKFRHSESSTRLDEESQMKGRQKVGLSEGDSSPRLGGAQNDAILYFNDQRKFGWVKLMPTEEVENLKFIQKLGKEPADFEDDEWAKVFRSSKKAVKVRLMDQDKIAGVGNIYACDGCWEAKVDPRRAANSLSEDELRRLRVGVVKVLKEGIFYGGATASDGKYIDLQGMGGKYQEHFKVYQREGEKCLRDDCSGVIVKVKLGGRGTFWCGECQG